MTSQSELIIDLRDGGDWSLDLCFAGLVYNLGPENVHMCPRKLKYTEWDSGKSVRDWVLNEEL